MKRLALALVCASCQLVVHEDSVPQTLATDVTGPWVDDSTPTQVVVLLVEGPADAEGNRPLHGVAVRPGVEAPLGFVSGAVQIGAHGEQAIRMTALGARVPPEIPNDPMALTSRPCVVGSNSDRCCGGIASCFCDGMDGQAGVCRASAIDFTLSGQVEVNRTTGDPVLELQGTLSVHTATSEASDTDVKIFLRRPPEWYRQYFGTNGSPPATLAKNPDLDCYGDNDPDPTNPDVEGPGGQHDGIPDACLEFLEEAQLVDVNARNFLTQYRCGDGVQQQDPPFNEQCDDGNGADDDDCVGVCVAATCGDGLVDRKEGALQEECDTGAASAPPPIGNDYTHDCLPGCKLNVCGDGYQDLDPIPGTTTPKEACDVKPQDDSGDCVHCQIAKCGDGVTHLHFNNPPLPGAGPLEQCDDANASDDDHCLTSCIFNVCGDGHVDRSIDPSTNLPYEECDLGAGNDVYGDCLPPGSLGPSDPGCHAARCGDRKQKIHGTPPLEVCDDGNTVTGDGCNASCTLLDQDDFQVNTTYPLSQEAPAIAAWPDGSFVVVFQSSDTAQPAFNYGIGLRARIFDEDGGPHTSAVNPDGDDFVVNAHPEGDHTGAVVTARTIGGQKSFVVAWMKYSAGVFDVEARAFDFDGNPLDIGGATDEFPVPFVSPSDQTHVLRDQAHPAIASAPDGRFVIAYDDDSDIGPDLYHKGVRARLFAADGLPMTNAVTGDDKDFQVNTTLWPAGFVPPSPSNMNMGDTCDPPRICDQVSPAVAMADDGSFVVAFVDFTQDPPTAPSTWPPPRPQNPAWGNDEIRARLFGPDGSPRPTQLGNQSLDCDPRNGSLIPSCCASSTCDFRVNVTTDGDQDAPVVVIAPDGSFVVAWADQSVVVPVADPDVRYRAFLASGTPRQPNDSRLSTTYFGSWQTQPAGARGPDGYFFAWTDTSGQTADNPSDIRGIALHFDGSMADPSDFIINTTQPQTQSSPAVGIGGNATIVVPFKDASYAARNCPGPDCIEAGVRARFYYHGNTGGQVLPRQPPGNAGVF